jgi:hypothetical protein
MPGFVPRNELMHQAHSTLMAKEFAGLVAILGAFHGAMLALS